MIEPLRMAHVVTGTHPGGAEMMLYKVVKARDTGRVDPIVIGLESPKPLEPRLRATGVPVYSLHVDPRRPDPRAFADLLRLLRRHDVELVQTWMYHGDVVGGMAAKFMKLPLLWNVQHSDLAPERNKWTTIQLARFCSTLARDWPDRVVYCSQRGAEVHEAMGYRSAKRVVLPNAFDLDAYQPDPEAGPAVRAELGLPDDALLIGHVARFDPQKDHETLLRAFARVHAARPEARLLMMGTHVDEANAQLMGWIDALGLRGVALPLGRRDDIPRMSAAFDVATLPSCGGEGFPNVVGEAMSCETPIVVCDVGDSAAIVDDPALVASPRDAEAVADGLLRVLAMPTDGRAALGRRLRDRVERLYEIGAVTRAYEDLWWTVAREHRIR